jgi:hypothetical protein
VKIEILDEAEADLIEGFQFYERQETGLGWYFLDSLFSDIDSLLLYAGTLFMGIIAASGNDFLLPFIT